jgi:glycosyltransferase involved in cell wall biosynthesis
LDSPKSGQKKLKKSILLIGNFLSPTAGVRSPCEELSELLSRAGWQVLTASLKPKRLPRLADMIATVWLQRKNYEVAQVEVYSGPAFFWAEAVCRTLRLAGKPYILTLHGGDLPAFSRRWPGRVRRLLSKATRVTTPSNYLRNEMGTFRQDLQLIPNFLDLKAYQFRERTRPRPRLMWLRAFHNIYNPQLAPRVLALLISEFPEMELIMLGPDKRDGSLASTQQVARKLGVEDKITIAGQVPKSQVPFRISQGDIFLNTTNVDNTPVSVLEAMATGLCVVSTKVGGIPYLLEHESDALLVPPDDPKAMAGAVRRLLLDSSLAARLSRQGRRKAEQWDTEVILPRWETLLAGVAEGRP